MHTYMRRLYHRTKNDDNMREARKRQYQQEKREYTALLRKSKMLSWTQYCSDTTTSNPWNAVYKLATGNTKKCSTLSILRQPDGTTTQNLAEKTRYMIESFTPEGNEESYNEQQKLLRALIKNR